MGTSTNFRVSKGIDTRSVSNVTGINVTDDIATTNTDISFAAATGLKIMNKANSPLVIGANNATAITVAANGNVTLAGTLTSTGGIAWSNLTSKPTTLSGYGITDGVSSTLVGANSGLATLDSSGKLTTSQLPSSVAGAMNYQGTWNASTNTPTLTSGSGTKGYYYKVSVAGSTAIDGQSTWQAGDFIAFNGTTWDAIDGASSEVLSVAGRTGAVTLSVSDVSGAAPLASPTFTGTTTSGNIVVTGAAATNRALFVNTGAANRWMVGTDAAAESGSNAGSNFIINRYDDAGAYIDHAVTINRSTASITFTGTLTGNGSGLSTLNASNLSSGTVATARLGTGTANSTTYLRGDGTWQTISGGATITDDTSTNSTFYPLFSSTTSGASTAVDTSSTKLTFNPSTGTLTSTLLSTGGLTTTGTTGLTLNNGTSNLVLFNTAGLGIPTFTTRSAGTKLVLRPEVGVSSTDYALGIDASGTLWSSVPLTTCYFKWYGGTTLAATLTGAGGLTTSHNIRATNAAVSSPTHGTYYFGTGDKYLHFDGSNFLFSGGPTYGSSFIATSNIQANGVTYTGAVNAASGTYYFGNNATKYLTCDGSGYSFAAGNLNTYGSFSSYDVNSNFTVNDSTYGILTRTAYANSATIAFWTNGVFACKFGLNTSNQFEWGGWSMAAGRMYLDASGNLTAAGNVTAYSDERLKENIKTIPNALDKTLSLRGVEYDRIDSGVHEIGLIAQEVQKIIPEVVLVGKDDNQTLSLDYGKLAGLFVETFKEQQSIINQLKAEIEALKVKVGV